MPQKHLKPVRVNRSPTRMRFHVRLARGPVCEGFGAAGLLERTRGPRGFGPVPTAHLLARRHCERRRGDQRPAGHGPGLRARAVASDLTIKALSLLCK